MSGTNEDMQKMRRVFYFHLHPLRVNLRSLKLSATFGLGIITATLFALLSLTGVLLMVYYQPSVEAAYGSMLDIQHAVSFGAFIRALHRLTAHAMVVCVGLHLIRVLAAGAYHDRALNWYIGLGLLVFTLGLAFTGYLLPWDQRSYWAVTVSANLFDLVPLIGNWGKELLIGGQQISQTTLLRFYTLHVALLPAGLVVLLGYHFWRIRKDGGLAFNSKEADSSQFVAAWPHLMYREAILVVVVIALCCLTACFYDAPLGAPPDFHHPSNPEKAPWYFLGLQEMVSYSALVGGIVFPLVIALLLMVLPHFERSEAAVGRLFGERRSRLTLAGFLLLALGMLVLFEWLFIGADHNHLGQVANSYVDLLNPASGMLALSVLGFFIAAKLGRSLRTGFLAVFVILVVAIIGFTVIGIGRGPDWVFYWPWQSWPGGGV
jgi:quinol-cytochrome oxidoreductase complex cytochrome b subunit